MKGIQLADPWSGDSLERLPSLLRHANWRWCRYSSVEVVTPSLLARAVAWHKVDVVVEATSRFHKLYLDRFIFQLIGNFFSRWTYFFGRRRSGCNGWDGLIGADHMLQLRDELFKCRSAFRIHLFFVLFCLKTKNKYKIGIQIQLVG